MLVFVRRRAPFESVRREPIALAHHRDADLDWLEGLPVGHMDLAAAAGRFRVLLEGRLENRRAKMHAGKPDRVEAPGELLAVEPWRADQLERAGSAAALRQHRALEQNRAGIDDRGVERRHVG